MNPWETEAAGARDSFLQDLANAGFAVRSSEKAEGDVDYHGQPVPVDITIPAGFPYEPPKVRPIDGTGGLSWHANLDGTLCLWAPEETGALPWRTADQVVLRVKEWLDGDAAGWKNDTFDLDLERYWPQTAGLVVHSDLDGLVGKVSRLTRTGKTWTVKAGPPLKGVKQSGCLVLDVGDLPMPLRTVDQVMEAVAATGETNERRVRSGAVQVVMIRYWRGGNAGVLTLLACARPFSFSSIAAAHEGDSTLQLRAGLDRAQLNEKAAAVLGVGAIGAQVADLLARAGVGALTLLDYDIVRPGNLIRHTAKATDIGRPKVDVVKQQLDGGPARSVVVVRQTLVTTVAEATEILQEHDLVVDATANQTATRLLLDGATALDRPVVSVCLVREGQVARIDRAPLRPGESHLSRTPEVPATARLVEGGCGDPVSPAPMWAATAAAARAVGACVDILTDRNEYPASLLDVLVAADCACGPIGSRS